MRAQDGKRFVFSQYRAFCKTSRAQRKAGVRGRQPLPAKRFIARVSEPSARQAERSGMRGCWGGCPHLPSDSLPAVACRLQGKLSAAESGAAAPKVRCPRQRAVCKASRAQRNAGVLGRLPSPAKRFVARGSEPPASQAERSGKRGRSPQSSLPAAASRLQGKPSAAESWGVGAAAPTCQALRFSRYRAACKTS
jgi:hypothetical protein